jgi:hypothetical protein
VQRWYFPQDGSVPITPFFCSSTLQCLPRASCECLWNESGKLPVSLVSRPLLHSTCVQLQSINVWISIHFFIHSLGHFYQVVQKRRSANMFPSISVYDSRFVAHCYCCYSSSYLYFLANFPYLEKIKVGEMIMLSVCESPISTSECLNQSLWGLICTS